MLQHLKRSISPYGLGVSLLVGLPVGYRRSLPVSGEIKVQHRMLLGVKMRRINEAAWPRRSVSLLSGTIVLATLTVGAAVGSAQAPSQSSAADVATATSPITISIQEAIRRAESSEPTYATAMADSKVAGLDKSIARAGLLPSATYHNQALYTQPNGQGQGIGVPFRFISNNSVHEYASQGVVNEEVGLAQLSALRRADAAAALASAELEIARRGLVSTVTGLYFGLAAADNKLGIAKLALDEAMDFTKLTGQREAVREAARADSVKAQLQQQQRERELADAKLAAEKARLELAVLLFPDPRTPYTINVTGDVTLGSRVEVELAAAKNNAELRSAIAALGVSSSDVLAARGAYLPGLGLNFTYGIDAPQFAVNGPDHVHNLGYSASVTVDIPVWDWLATEHRVKQSEIRRDAAKVALTATQRRMIARLDETYAEAAGARDQLASLNASVDTAAESLRLTKLRYTGGEATVLEVVDAQAAFVTAQNAREDGRVRFRAALADLQTLTGTM
jgi:outer membrane protein TolC